MDTTTGHPDAFLRFAAEVSGGSCDPILNHCDCSYDTMQETSRDTELFHSRSPDRGTFRSAVALVLLDTSEALHHGSRTTSMVNHIPIPIILLIWLFGGLHG